MRMQNSSESAVMMKDGEFQEPADVEENMMTVVLQGSTGTVRRDGATQAAHNLAAHLKCRKNFHESNCRRDA